LNCPACRKPARLLIGGDVLPAKAAVYRCHDCGMDFFDRTPDEDYWRTDGQNEIYEDGAVAAERMVFFDAILSKLSAFGGRGSLLDVGAGKGELAIAAAARGWQVSVVEPSKEATRGLEAKGIHEVHNTGFEDFAPERPYDCVAFMDVLEHTRNPELVVKKAAECLAPGGLLAALTPDAEAPTRQMALAAAAFAPAFGGLLKYQYYLPHYCYLSGKAFRQMCRQSGLEVIAIERIATPKHFLLAKLKRHYGRYSGNRLFCAAASLAYPFAHLVLKNKLLAFARKPA
jgi:2-polyprenyl-3-methyl-5-hydroxy-6-metoxy-1,4-benzoquinol methylase